MKLTQWKCENERCHKSFYGDKEDAETALKQLSCPFCGSFVMYLNETEFDDRSKLDVKVLQEVNKNMEKAQYFLDKLMGGNGD